MLSTEQSYEDTSNHSFQDGLGGQNFTEGFRSSGSLKELIVALSKLRELYMSKEWGGHSLASYVSHPRAAKASNPKKYNELTEAIGASLNVIDEFERSAQIDALSLAIMLKNSVFSDSFCSTLYIVDRVSAKEGGTHTPLLPRAEESIQKIIEKGGEALTSALLDRDADDLADWMKKVCCDLSDLDADTSALSNFRLHATHDHLKLAGEVARNKNHPLRASFDTWLKERAGHKTLIGEVIDELELPLSPSRRPAWPQAEDRPASRAPAPPPPSAPSLKPKVELPKESLTDGIDGIEEVGSNDTRRSPIQSGNTGGDKQKDKFSLKQEAKQKERDEKLRRAGIKPDNEIGKSRHELNRKLPGKPKPGS